MTTNKKKDYTIGKSTSTYFAWFYEKSLYKPQKIMPEMRFSLQIEVYFLRGTYEFGRPDHPTVHQAGEWTRETRETESVFRFFDIDVVIREMKIYYYNKNWSKAAWPCFLPSVLILIKNH